MESGKVRSKTGRAWKVWNSTTKTIIFLGFHWNRAIERIFRFVVQIYGETSLKSDTFDGCRRRRRRSLQSEKGSILIIFLTAFSSPSLAASRKPGRKKGRKRNPTPNLSPSISGGEKKCVFPSLAPPSFVSNPLQ